MARAEWSVTAAAMLHQEVGVEPLDSLLAEEKVDRLRDPRIEVQLIIVMSFS